MTIHQPATFGYLGSYIYISIRMYVYVYVHVYAYGPKTEVAKRYFFVAEVLDATLMMGWGGVGWGMLTFV